jgi:hypothetical protein
VAPNQVGVALYLEGEAHLGVVVVHPLEEARESSLVEVVSEKAAYPLLCCRRQSA